MRTATCMLLVLVQPYLHGMPGMFATAACFVWPAEHGGLHVCSPVLPASSATSMLRCLRAAAMLVPRSAGAAASPDLTCKGLSAALGDSGVSGSCMHFDTSSASTTTRLPHIYGIALLLKIFNTSEQSLDDLSRNLDAEQSQSRQSRCCRNQLLSPTCH